MVNGKIQLLESESFPSKILIFSKDAFAIRKTDRVSPTLTEPCFYPAAKPPLHSPLVPGTRVPFSVQFSLLNMVS